MVAWLKNPISFVQFLIFGLITFAFASGSAYAVASFNEVGNVGGFEANTTFTPTVQNAQYTSAQCMGGFQSVQMARYIGYHGILNRFVIASKGGGVTALTIYAFATSPASSTCTDRGSFTLAAADISKLICAPFVVTPAVAIGGTASFAENASMQCHFVTVGDAKVYFAILSGGTWTPASTSDLVVVVGGIED